MRVAVASFEFEGNTLSALLHRREDFARKVLAEGADALAAIRGNALAVTGGIEVLEAAGHEVVPILVALGGSGGRVETAFYDDIRARILAGIATAAPIDGVYLALHGAMICEREEDPEGDILAAARSLIGDTVPVAVSLDLHAHVTPRMVDAADIIVGYETYPHDDAYTTGKRAAALLVETMAGRIRPVMRMRKIAAILPVTGGSTREDGPMARLRAMARAEESAGLLSVSYFPVQPWLDVRGAGCVGLAIADGDAARAEAAATRFATAMWETRREFDLPVHAPDAAVRMALAMPARTVILSDAPDCVGGGAPGDTPAVLAALLRHATQFPSVVLVVDPEAAAAARRAGLGATIAVTIGARLDPRFHPPVPVEAQVESLHDGAFVYAAGPAAGTPGDMGPTAVLRLGELRIVVPSFATYEYGDEQYRAAGIDIRAFRLAVFKNPMNFRTLLGPGIDWLIVDGAGPTAPRLAGIAWHVKERPFWPCDDAAEPLFIE